MFTPESGRKRSLFEGIVDSGRLNEKLAKTHTNASENLGDEGRVGKTDHLSFEVRVKTFRVDISERRDWCGGGEAPRDRLLRTTEHSTKEIGQEHQIQIIFLDK